MSQTKLFVVIQVDIECGGTDSRVARDSSGPVIRAGIAVSIQAARDVIRAIRIREGIDEGEAIAHRDVPDLPDAADKGSCAASHCGVFRNPDIHAGVEAMSVIER